MAQGLAVSVYINSLFSVVLDVVDKDFDGECKDNLYIAFNGFMLY